MRCICIVDYFHKHSVRCLFVLNKSEPKVFAILQTKGIDYVVLENEIDVLKIKDVILGTIIILDINNKVLFRDARDYRAYINFLKENDFTVVSFEEFSAEVFPSDLIIIPYVGAEKLEINNDISRRHFLGPGYFIFREEFLSSPKITIHEEVKSIFVCMGGSDPDQLTEKYLIFLINSGYLLDIKIVINHLDKKRNETIQNILSSYSGTSELIINPGDLCAVICSCDIGLVNSGLIKYETSLVGLPCLSVSNNLHHEMVMQYFSEPGSIIHLGLADEMTEDHFKSSLSILMENVEIRKELSRKCKSMFDGKGIQKLYDYVIEFKNK